MGDVTLFVCGGGARAVLSDATEVPDIPTVMMNSNSSSTISLVPEDMPGAYGDQYLAYSLALDNRDAILERLHGMRVVVLFSILGGGSGIGIPLGISEMARECGCKVVSVVGLPMVFERERRERALAALPQVLEYSDRVFILDMESLNRNYPDVKFVHILRMASRSTVFAVDNLAHSMEGPFFSTFPKKVYTFAYTSDMDPSKAVERATGSTMFQTSPDYGKMIVMVSSGFGTAQIESIYSTVVDMTGIIPDIVKRDDREDTKVLVFLPVQL